MRSMKGVSHLAQTFARAFSAQALRLEGKVALTTGAASGIGKETASKFISNGAKVVIADFQHQLGQETAKELGPNASFIPCDVAKESDISEAVDFTISKYNKLDIMYNNAGIASGAPNIVDLDLEEFDRIIDINVRGVVTGIKHAARVMIPRGTGSILCTASTAGVMGGEVQHSYTITKFAVVGIVKSLASELCKYGIRVNAISPHVTITPLVTDLFGGMYSKHDMKWVVDTIYNAGPLKGVNLEASDVANAALYLASDESKYVNGLNLVVDGGFTSFKYLGYPEPDEP